MQRVYNRILIYLVLIMVVLSGCPELGYYIMPDLTGLSEEDANTLISEMGLIQEEVQEEYSDTIPEGHVISQEPEAGSVTRTGMPVYLSLSLGPAPWSKMYGGIGGEIAGAVQPTSDGGYIIAGVTNSFIGVSSDVYLIKIDAAGNVEWSNHYGGTGKERAYAVCETTEGGFVAAGLLSRSGEYNEVYVVKVDASGTELWSKEFGGADHDIAYAVMELSDHGLLIVGETYSFGAGDSDIYLIKTDAQGNEAWSKTLGGPEGDFGRSVIETSDDGILIAGSTFSFGADDYDVYLVKTDLAGEEQWSTVTHLSGADQAYAVRQTTDDGFIVTGSTGFSTVSDYDVCLIKYNALGVKQWSKSLGGAEHDYGYGILQSADGGYVIAGRTASYGAGLEDVYLLKTNASGTLQWSTTYGGTEDEYAFALQPATNGGYLLAGWTDSFGERGTDIYLIQTDADGNAPVPPLAVLSD